jgi:hypothetical protein
MEIIAAASLIQLICSHARSQDRLAARWPTSS